MNFSGDEDDGDNRSDRGLSDMEEDDVDEEDMDSFELIDGSEYESILSAEWPSSSISSSNACLSQASKLKCFVFRPNALIRIKYNPFRPTPRSGHRIVCTESEIFSLGGYNPSVEEAPIGYRIGGCLFQELWKYNIATNRWQLVMDDKTANMPRELASNSFIKYKNALIAYGGTGYPFGLTCSSQCYIFNTKKACITRLEASGVLPTPQYGAAIVMHDNCLYTIGGTTGFDYSCDVYRLDLRTKLWENIYNSRPEMREDPEGRYRHEIAYDEKYIYILGGGTSQMSFDMQTLPAFDLNEHKWVYMKTQPDPTLEGVYGYPPPRKCHSLVQYKNDGEFEAVIAGGLGDDQFAFSDLWKLQLKTLQWTLLKSSEMKIPTYFHSAATSGNGCMYIFGGISSQEELTRTNRMYKIWTKIPKLSEMCWDAITYYDPELDRFTQNELCQMGIPEKFARRVPDVIVNDATSSNSIECPSPLKRIRCLSE